MIVSAKQSSTGADQGERFDIAAGHHAELSGFRLLWRARERGIDKSDLVFAESRSKLHCRVRLAVEQSATMRPVLHPSECRYRQGWLLNLRAAGDADNDEIRLRRNIGDGRTFDSAQSDETIHRRPVPVGDDRQGKTLGDDVLADAVTHEADANKADALDCHGSFPRSWARRPELLAARSPDEFADLFLPFCLGMGKRGHAILVGEVGSAPFSSTILTMS